TTTKQGIPFPILCALPSKNRFQFTHLNPVLAALNSPKGFGAKKTTKKSKKPKKDYENDDDKEEEEDEEVDNREEGVIPEIVTNRMMSRMGLSVGIPLFFGLLFFPFFYYLKVGFKIDVPTWISFIVSFVFFGTALLGVSYGIVSSSWDPMREGSLLGCNEAKKNRPVFWQSIWDDQKRSRMRILSPLIRVVEDFNVSNLFIRFLVFVIIVIFSWAPYVLTQFSEIHVRCDRYSKLELNLNADV
ncbi:protein PAM68, chloroplastic-like, partial [Primulina eburnea]|uniref:protein PAM68, chloroplastic-like n=1 Tax=Primulina eburnea TaxID=1245227 RepID=UPI003C6C6A75